MPAKQDANLGLNYGWDLGEDNWKDGMDANLVKLGTLINAAVEAVAAAPTVTADGTRYIVGDTPSGAFLAQAGKLAVMVGTAWTFYPPKVGWNVFNKATSTVFRYNGTAWVEDTQTSTALLVRRHEDNLMGGVAGVANSPTLTVDGTRYIVGATPSGAFATATPNQIAAMAGGTWAFYTPFNGQLIYNYAASADYRFNGSAWVAAVSESALAIKHENMSYGPVQGVANAPTVTSNGTRYIVGTTPTGAFAGQANKLAVMVSGTWTFYSAFAGLEVFNLGTGTPWRYSGTAWGNTTAVTADAKDASSATLTATPAGVREFMEQYGFTSSYTVDAADLNALTGATDRTVVFGFNASTLHTPASGMYGRGIQFAGGGNYSTQLVIQNDTGAVFIRFHNGTVWSAWGTPGNLLNLSTDQTISGTKTFLTRFRVQHGWPAFELVSTNVAENVQGSSVFLESSGGSTYFIIRSRDGSAAQMVLSLPSYKAGNYVLWGNANTTVDGNGFIKAASPIVRLTNDPALMQPSFLEGFTLAGYAAVNDEAEGVTAEKISTGVYRVTGSLGLHKDGWTMEIPQDGNGNRLCFVETKTEENGDIIVSVFKRRFDIDTAMVVAGAPMDIPNGRWIDLRLDMPEDSIWNVAQQSLDTPAAEDGELI